MKLVIASIEYSCFKCGRLIKKREACYEDGTRYYHEKCREVEEKK